MTMNDQLKIQDSPDKIHINTHPNLNFSLQKHYTVYATLITSGSEGVITESTSFSKYIQSYNQYTLCQPTYALYCSMQVQLCIFLTALHQ